MRKTFNHPLFKELAEIYWLNDDAGTVVANLKTGNILKVHTKEAKEPFVRLSNNGKSFSMTINKLRMLTFNGESYKKGLIVIRLDGNKNNNHLSNLLFGTRAMQSRIAMKKKVNFKRVQAMGRISGKQNIKNALAWKRKNVDISEETKSGVLMSRDSGETKSETLLKFGISKSSYSRIINQKKVNL